MDTSNLWTRHGQRLCKKLLYNSNIVESGIINQNWIDANIDKNDLDVRYINKFYGLLALEIWWRLFITKKLTPNDKL